MPEDKLIDPAWLVKARKDRKKFAMRVVLVFAILSVLAWCWSLVSSIAILRSVPKEPPVIV